MLFRLIVLSALLLLPAGAQAAAKRVALLIGNQDYQINSLDLKNPHNDVAAIGKALTKVGFQVRTVKDVGFGKLQKEINRYAKRLRAAGKGAVGFFYYSGHGALNEQNRFNYLIPTDVETVDSADLWDGSVRLKRIVDDLKDKAPNAVHFVVFDACRNELKLASKGSKSLRQSKGFRPIQERVRGMLIAYATAEGEIASDVGAKVGPYAEALSEWITKPGVEAVNMFRGVQVSVFNNIGQEPWYTHGALRRVYFAGQNTRAKPKIDLAVVKRQVEIAFWNSVKDSKNPDLIRTYVARYPNGVFAEPARVLTGNLEKAALANRKELELREANLKKRRAAEAAKADRQRAQQAKQLAALVKAQDEAARLKNKILNNERQNKAATQAWKLIETSSNEAVLSRYVKKYGNSPYAEIARFRLTALAERRLQNKLLTSWKAVQNSKDPKLLRNFILQHPDTHFSRLAEEKIASLQRPAVKPPNALGNNAEVSEKELARSLQNQLKRVGCYNGKVDGIWGNGSRRSLKNFSKFAKLKLADLAPTPKTISLVSGKKGTICPLVASRPSVKTGTQKTNSKKTSSKARKTRSVKKKCLSYSQCIAICQRDPGRNAYCSSSCSGAWGSNLASRSGLKVCGS